MDYQHQTTTARLAGSADQGVERPRLARIAGAADELERIAECIQGFIDRCHGAGVAEKTGPTPVPSGHFGELDRLNDNLDRVEKLARELKNIG